MLSKYDIVHVQLFATVIRENDPASVVKNLTSLLSKFRILGCVSAKSRVYKEHPSIGLGLGKLTVEIEPGGWLQWNDSDINAHQIVSISEPGADMKCTQDMMALMAKPRNAERDVFKYVEQAFIQYPSEPGFLVSAFPKRSPSKHYLGWLTCGTLSWVAQLGDVFVQQGLEAVEFERFPISDHNKLWVGLNCCMLVEEYCRTLERESTSPDDVARLQSLRETIAGAAAAALRGVAISLTLVQAVGRKRL